MTPTTDYTIAFSTGAATCVYIYRQVFSMMREQKNGNGKMRTFAQDPEHYWDSMRRNVTEPLGKILDKQTDILGEQVKGNSEIMGLLVRLEERTRRP